MWNGLSRVCFGGCWAALNRRFGAWMGDEQASGPLGVKVERPQRSEDERP